MLNINFVTSPLYFVTGLTIGGKAYLQGQREGKAVVYRHGQYPQGVIGPVQFLWQSLPPCPKGTSHTDREKDRALLTQYEPISLWIWCHPAMHADILSEVTALVASFNARKFAQSAGHPTADTFHNPATSEPSKEEEEDTKLVSVRDLKSELLRFRLIGPRSHALLMEALKPVLNLNSDKDGGSSETETDSMEVDPPGIPDAPRWWQHGSQVDLHLCRHSELLSESFEYLKSATSPAQFTKGTVIGMTVLDPRLSTPSKKIDLVSVHYPPKKNGFVTPRKRKKGREEEVSSENSEADEIDANNLASSTGPGPTSDAELGVLSSAGIEQAIETKSEVNPVVVSSLPAELAYSPIWNPYVRVIVSNSKVSTHIINKLRSEKFLRSSELNLGTKASKIPVLLIQQTLSTPSSSVSDRKRTMLPTVPQVGCGWDIVIPANWGREFWVSLVYHGARACGMKELKKCSLEILTPHFPNDFPDTPAGQLHYEEERKILEERFRRYPPDKRRNYGKLLISSPFDFPWSEIVSTWKKESRINRICHPLQSVKRIKLDEELGPQHEQQQEEAGFPFESLLEESRARKRTLDSHNVSDSQVAPLPLMSILSPMYVLRSKEVMCSLNQLIDHLFTHKLQQSNMSSGTPPSSSESAYQRSLFRSAVHEFSINSHLRNHSSALLGVRVQMYQRGTLTERDMISMPTVSDFSPLLSCSRSRPHSGPKEELHPKGITLDEGHSLTIGVSSLTRKEMKEMKEERKLKEKLLKKSKGTCYVYKCICSTCMFYSLVAY